MKLARLSLVSLALTAASLFVLPSCGGARTSTTTLTAAGPIIQKIYVGGRIVTMDSARPQVEAIAVRDGVIFRVGSRQEILALRSPTTEIVELGDRALLPGFIDAHGHIALSAAATSFVNLAPPPLGSVRTLAEVRAELQRQVSLRGLTPASWVIGYGYDESMIAEHREPTQGELDTLSKDVPIVLLHSSLERAVANSSALRAAKVPPEMVREPAGTVDARALPLLFSARPQPPMDEKLRQLDSAQTLYASHGFTTAEDTGSLGVDLDLFDAAAAARRLKVDVISYPHWLEADRSVAERTVGGGYRDHFKIGGAAMFIDGTENERVQLFVFRMLSRQGQIVAQCDGDAAVDQLIEATSLALSRTQPFDHREVMFIDGTARDDRLDKMKSLAIAPSFFASRIFYSGDSDRAAMPADVGQMMPIGSAARRGMPVTLYANAPVTPPDALALVWSAVTRTTRSGAVLGPEQRIDVPTALRGVTINAAWQHFEDDKKGSITPGKLADLVILSASPLEVQPAAIKDIRVLETVKGGVTIHRASAR